MTDTLKDLTKWPTNEADVTVDLILRCVGADTQRLYLEKEKAIEGGDHLASPLYMAQTIAIISAVGLMSCLRTLRNTNPDLALELARDHWRMCDAGDSFGEMLWEFTEDAGLDPALVKL